jgi:hypothetical protein
LSLLQQENEVIKKNIEKMKMKNQQLQMKIQIKNSAELRTSDIYKIKVASRNEDSLRNQQAKTTVRKTVLSK